MDLICSFCHFLSAENTPRNMPETRKPFFPNRNHKKSSFWVFSGKVLWWRSEFQLAKLLFWSRNQLWKQWGTLWPNESFGRNTRMRKYWTLRRITLHFLYGSKLNRLSSGILGQALKHTNRKERNSPRGIHGLIPQCIISRDFSWRQGKVADSAALVALFEMRLFQKSIRNLVSYIWSKVTKKSPSRLGKLISFTEILKSWKLRKMFFEIHSQRNYRKFFFLVSCIVPKKRKVASYRRNNNSFVSLKMG